MAWRSLHSVHDEEKPFELEVSWVCDESEGEFRRVPADLVAEATAAAKAALADSDMWAPRTTLPPCLCLHFLCPLPTITGGCIVALCLSSPCSTFRLSLSDNSPMLRAGTTDNILSISGCAVIHSAQKLYGTGRMQCCLYSALLAV